MEDDYSFRKFTEEDLDFIDQIEKYALEMSIVNESIDFLVHELYKFGNYASDKLTDEKKKKLFVRMKNQSSGIGIFKMLERIEECTLELSSKERKYVDRLRRLLELQTGRLDLQMKFQNIQVLNKKEYLFNPPINKDVKIKINNYKKLKTIPPRGLKKLAKEACEKLIEDNIIQEELVETRKNRVISKPIVSFLKENYIVTTQNEKSISDYFRKYELQIKNRNNKLVVIDGYKRKF